MLSKKSAASRWNATIELHRDTFGVTPSYILGRLARATIATRRNAPLKR